MKNNNYLIVLSFIVNLTHGYAQTETASSDFGSNTTSTHPLSIHAFSDAFSLVKDTLSHTQTLTSPLTHLTPNTQPQTFNTQLKTAHFKLIDFFQSSDTFDKKRFWGFVGASSSFYVGTVLVLDKVWYAQYDRSAFHFFNDRGEWQDMDKAGHFLTAYTETKWIYGAMRWTGMANNRAAWAGMATGTALQATLEVLDGFSTEWGFSWADMAANTAGCALFGIQQAVWKEQRLVLKVSNTPRRYSDAAIASTDGSKTSSLRQRTDDLYGTNYAQTFFKDYNALTWWLSVNPKSFNPDSKVPAWLNIALGYGAENMFGGYNNVWPTKKPEFVLSKTDVPRYRQFYLSLDIDLSKIKTKSKFINALAKTFNFIKIPSPTLEFNTLGKFKVHPLFF